MMKSKTDLSNNGNNHIKNFNTMSEKGNARRERYQERQAKQGAKVFNWILALLAIGAVAFLIFSITQG